MDEAAQTEAVQTEPVKAKDHMMRELLRPLVEELMANTFDVYKTVNTFERQYIRDLIREILGEERLKEQQYMKETEYEKIRQRDEIMRMKTKYFQEAYKPEHPMFSEMLKKIKP